MCHKDCQKPILSSCHFMSSIKSVSAGLWLTNPWLTIDKVSLDMKIMNKMVDGYSCVCCTTRVIAIFDVSKQLIILELNASDESLTLSSGRKRLWLFCSIIHLVENVYYPTMIPSSSSLRLLPNSEYDEPDPDDDLSFRALSCKSKEKATPKTAMNK